MKIKKEQFNRLTMSIKTVSESVRASIKERMEQNMLILELKEQLEKERESSKGWKQGYDNLLKENSALTKEKDGGNEKDFIKIRNENKNLRKELTELIHEIDSVREEKKSIHEKFMNLTGEYDVFIRTFKGLETRHNDLMKSNNQNLKEISTLNKEIESLEFKNRETENRYETAKKLTIHLNERIDTLTDINSGLLKQKRKSEVRSKLIGNKKKK